MESKYLWLQQMVNLKKIFIEKIPGKLNSADVGTKFLAKLDLHRFAHELGIRWTQQDGSAQSVNMVVDDDQREHDEFTDEVMNMINLLSSLSLTNNRQRMAALAALTLVRGVGGHEIVPVKNSYAVWFPNMTVTGRQLFTIFLTFLLLIFVRWTINFIYK